jgi:CRISPR system Cascade subunit CasD
MLAFGGIAIDHIGITRDFPAASMLTGLIANALGWHRADWRRHQALQDRLVFASRLDRLSVTGTLTDMQNAQLYQNKVGWWTTGECPERRGGGKNTYLSPHQRFRDYHADASVTLALRLVPANLDPDLDSVTRALTRPARPIFLGRKPCLPTTQVLHGEQSAATAYDALMGVPVSEGADSTMRCCWPVSEGPETGSSVHRIVDLADLRNWKSGLHGGSRRVVEGTIVCAGVSS